MTTTGVPSPKTVAASWCRPTVIMTVPPDIPHLP
jgi:hypothetical protein